MNNNNKEQEKKVIRLEFSYVEILEDDTDYQLKTLPMSYLTKMMMKANEIGLQGRKIENILYASFGAFGIAISMADGHITDGAISIRDRCVEAITNLLKE